MNAIVSGKGFVVTVGFESCTIPQLRDRTYLWSELLLVQSDIPNATEGVVGTVGFKEPCVRNFRILLGLYRPNGQGFLLRNSCKTVQIKLVHVYLLKDPVLPETKLFYDTMYLGKHKLPSETPDIQEPFVFKDLPWSMWFDTLPWFNETLHAETTMANLMYNWMAKPNDAMVLRKKLKLWVLFVHKMLNYVVSMDFTKYKESEGISAHYYPEFSNGGDCKDYASYIVRSFHISQKICNVCNIEEWKEVFSKDASVYYHGLRIHGGEHINILYRNPEKIYMLDPTNNTVCRFNQNKTKQYIEKSFYCSSMEDGIQKVTETLEFRKTSKRLC